MTLRRKFLRFGLPLVLILVIGVAVVGFLKKIRQIASEYETVRVIDEVTKYVDTHEGLWPRSWNDLPVSEAIREKVRIRFDVEPSNLIRDHDALRAAIQPLGGDYHTYPHSELHYDDLRSALEDAGKVDRSRRRLE